MTGRTWYGTRNEAGEMVATDVEGFVDAVNSGGVGFAAPLDVEPAPAEPFDWAAAGWTEIGRTEG